MPKPLSKAEIEDFREKLSDAATRLFAERGRDGFTLKELAAELGVSAMTPYRYFENKDAMLAAVRARAFDRFADALEAAYARSGSAPERAFAVYDAYVNFARHEPSAYRLMFDVSQPDEEKYPDLVRATARARNTMTDYVRGLLDAGLIEGDPELIGHVFWVALHGAIVLEMAGKLSPECSPQSIRQTTFIALVNAFRPKHST
ncbi:MAG TPA: TetR/AcrR family transcriptional regulator [Rhizomicrobium sp.]